MFDPNPEEPQNLGRIPFLTGVFLDPITGPFTLNRPVAVFRRSDTDKITEIDESATEDIYSQNELDAHHAQLGWPSPNRLPSKPGDALALGGQRTLGNETWASRRFMVQRATMNISSEDLRPMESFVDAVEAALHQVTNVLQIQALEKVFATWGHVIPLNMVAGACLAVTGTLSNGAALPGGIPTNSPSGNPPYNLTDIIDRHLGTTRCFGRRLESRVQGGFSEALLNGGYEGWLRSVTENPSSWTVIKVHRVAPITDILDNKLRAQIEQLYTTSFIHRSPAVGTPHGLAFDSGVHGLRTIESIKIWFSDSRVRDISVTYVGGAVAGPYAFGINNPDSQSDVFVLVSGQCITDMFVWHQVDGWITGLQFVKNGLECSPIYGIRDRQTNQTYPPVLLSGNGGALLGISGTYNPDNLCQVKAVWRSDMVTRRHRYTQTSFTRSGHGVIFNDLQYIADPASSRIVEITARAEGSLANLRTTYLSNSGGDLVRSETTPRGWDAGPLQTIILEDDEYIIKVRGSHNNTWMHQVQFITNKREHPPFGTDKGNTPFSFDAPKTVDGRDMVLHYMAGKSEGCVHSFLFVWAEMPLHTGA